MWAFDNPYTKEGILYIRCDAIFDTDFEWIGNDNAIGNASLTADFKQYVPIVLNGAKSTNKIKAGVLNKFTIEVPLEDFNILKPTNVYIKIPIKEAGINQNLFVNFSISW